MFLFHSVSHRQTFLVKRVSQLRVKRVIFGLNLYKNRVKTLELFVAIVIASTVMEVLWLCPVPRNTVAITFHHSNKDEVWTKGRLINAFILNCTATKKRL